MKVYPGSFSYEIWHELPIPMYMKVYYFNVTNAEEVESDVTAMPRLQELGPYVFKEMHLKVRSKCRSQLHPIFPFYVRYGVEIPALMQARVYITKAMNHV